MGVQKNFPVVSDKGTDQRERERRRKKLSDVLFSVVVVSPPPLPKDASLSSSSHLSRQRPSVVNVSSSCKTDIRSRLALFAVSTLSLTRS